MSNLSKGTFVELSNLRGNFGLSTSFDSWLTYCVLSQQNSVSVVFVLWTFWLGKFSVCESKIAFKPPSPFSLLLVFNSFWLPKSSFKVKGIKILVEKKSHIKEKLCTGILWCFCNFLTSPAKRGRPLKKVPRCSWKVGCFEGNSGVLWIREKSL